MQAYSIVASALELLQPLYWLRIYWHFIANQQHALSIATPKIASRSFAIDAFSLVAAVQQALE